jgi:hypothetical protein
MRALLVLPLLLLAGSAAAQRTPSVTLAADFGPSFPFGDFADDGAETGWGLGVSGAVRITRGIGVYASYERATFDIDSSAAGADVEDWTDSGIGVGARFWFPTAANARVQPWTQLGIGWHDVDPPPGRAEFADVDTDGIRTIEGGGGIDIAVAKRTLFLRPAIRYRKYSFEADAGQSVSKRSVAYLTLALGAAIVIAPR